MWLLLHHTGAPYSAGAYTSARVDVLRERKLEPSTRQNRTSGIRTSRVPGGHPRHDNRGTGKRHYQEGTREQYRGKPDWRKGWAGGRTKEELFSGSDRWHQEKHYDLRWRLYHPENRYKTEQGGGRSRVFTGSNGLHLSGKGAAVLAEGLSGAVASGLGKVRYLN